MSSEIRNGRLPLGGFFLMDASLAFLIVDRFIFLFGGNFLFLGEVAIMVDGFGWATANG